MSLASIWETKRSLKNISVALIGQSLDHDLRFDVAGVQVGVVSAFIIERDDLDHTKVLPATILNISKLPNGPPWGFTNHKYGFCKINNRLCW